MSLSLVDWKDRIDEDLVANDVTVTHICYQFPQIHKTPQACLESLNLWDNSDDKKRYVLLYGVVKMFVESPIDVGRPLINMIQVMKILTSHRSTVFANVAR